MSALRAFHGDAAVKAKYVARVAAHMAADELIHGVGWKNGKGCAIGCTFETYSHARGPIEIGLPEWLMHLEDKIFESLPADESRDFVSKFLTVIPVGADVEPVRHKLAIRRIDRLLALQHSAIEINNSDVQAAIQQTIAALKSVRLCHEAEIGGHSCDWSAARSAAWSAWSASSAAWSAAWSALSALSAAQAAAWSAARSAAAGAESAAWSASSAAESAAESAARSAAWSKALAAESAAWSAKSAAWKQEADDLLELLQKAQGERA